MVCVSGGELRPAGRAPSPCLHIGSIELDEAVENVDARLGSPWKTVETERRRTVRVYPLHGDAEALPYLAVTIEEGRVAAIQLSGEETPDPYGFSGLRLGDPARQLKEILGPAGAKERLENTDATLLSYLPIPVSIEIANEKIVSIKIWRRRS